MRFLIVGGGVIGLSVAKSLAKSVSATSIRLLEKEPQVGAHTSGRNSGVLHAGFYYASDSQKAKYCKQGNAFWTDFCLKNDVPIKQCGKFVVCTSEHQIPAMHKLYE
jgi:L-2-hydroxyglutarate oxidase LhgO